MYTTSILKIYILTQSNILIEIHYIIRTLMKHLIILYNFNNNNNNNNNKNTTAVLYFLLLLHTLEILQEIADVWCQL